MTKLIFLGLAILVFIVGCKSYRPMGTFRSITQEMYRKEDTLQLKDFILCFSKEYYDAHGSFYSSVKRTNETNEDSVFNVFKSSFRSLDLPILELPGNLNHCDESFHRNNTARVWKIKNKKIKEIAKHEGNNPVVIPFIRIDQYTYVRLQGDPATNSIINKVSFLTVIIMVVQNDNLIYRRSFRYSFGEHVESRTDPYPEIEQIHWDNLVRLAMEDYMKRMK